MLNPSNLRQIAVQAIPYVHPLIPTFRDIEFSVQTSGAGLSRHLDGGKVGISLGAAAIFVSWVL